MITREYRPVASLPNALPVKVTVAAGFVQIDSRNPDMSMRAPLNQVRIESASFAGQPASKVNGEASTDQWWQVTLTVDDGADLAGVIAGVQSAVQRL